MPTFDAERLTAYSESSPRTQQIDTLQYHHAATTSLDALEYNMEPGGREVSANCALDTDGTLILKVPIDRRAFTSGVASYDQRCITVETVNTSGSPEWGISDAEHRRMGRLAAEMYREGLLQGLFYGTGGIIGHKDVPGTYATACPGPCYDADLILKYAQEYLNPLTQSKGRPLMSALYVKQSTMKNNARTTTTLCALAGENPGTGNANWIEFTSPVINGSDWKDLNAAVFRGFGSRESILLNDEDWAKWKKAYTAVPTVKVETSAKVDATAFKPLTDLMSTLIAAVTDLPAKIEAARGKR